ncbi:hypothetical protein [Ferdinandcohnia sp. Marseille-Q9671]
MREEKVGIYFRIIVAVALASSLILNIVLVNRMSEIKNSLINLEANIHSNMDGQASHVNQILNEFKEEQSWISHITMDLKHQPINDSKAKARFSWQVKELQENSEVEFHYSIGNSEQYTTLSAKEVQKGLFQAEVAIDVDTEPQWHVSHSTSDSVYSQDVSEKEAIEAQQNTINFYVTASYGDLVKSSEIHTEYLDELRTSYYGILQIDTHFYEKKMDIVMSSFQINESTVGIDEAHLLTYQGDTLIAEEVMKSTTEQPEFGEHMFQLTQLKQFENMKLVIKVVYSNGETFEKVVFS